MARAASKPKKEISMEEALWKSADKLRGSVEPAEYKHVDVYKRQLPGQANIRS